MIKNNPEVIKFSKQGDRLGKLPWDSNWQSCKRKEKDKACKEFGIMPSMENCQNEYAKLKHENKIIKDIKYNCKPLFKYK